MEGVDRLARGGDRDGPDRRGCPPYRRVDEAEGYRWVTRLSSLAQEWFIEKSDPLHPQLFQSQTEYRKLLVDNPDVRYGFCALDEAADLPAGRHPG